jgi:hypothetical protein
MSVVRPFTLFQRKLKLTFSPLVFADLKVSIVRIPLRIVSSLAVIMMNDKNGVFTPQLMIE